MRAARLPARSRLASSSLGAIVLAIAAANGARAVQPGATPDAFSIPLPRAMQAPVPLRPSAEEARRRFPAFARFESAEGSGWLLGSVREELSTPAALFGPGIPLVDRHANREALRNAVVGFVASHAALLGCDPAELRIAEVREHGALRQVVLQQTHRGLDVIGGRVEVYVKEGEVVLLDSSFHRGVDVPRSPSLSVEAAQSAAMVGIPFDSRTDAHVGEARLVVRPMRAEGEVVFFLAYEIATRTVRPRGRWTSYVDATTGTLLSRENHAAFAEIPITVTADVRAPGSGSSSVRVALADALVSADALDRFTSPDGTVRLEVVDGAERSVTTELRGRWTDVQVAGGVRGVIERAGRAGEALSLHWDDSNSHAAERTTYHHLQLARAWMETYDPDFELLDYVMPVTVNREEDVCNAFWDGEGLGFYRAGGGCENAGENPSIIYHEFQHAVTQFTYAPDPPPTSSGLSEAFSDAFAMSLAGSPRVGDGFFGGQGFIRSGENRRRYPAEECDGSPHCLGEPLMGALWQARANLSRSLGAVEGVAVYDRLFRAAVRTKPYSAPDFLVRFLLADDDDRDLSDGTPHWRDICDAFSRHALPCPEIGEYIAFAHEPLVDPDGPSAPYAVSARIVAVEAGEILPASCRAHYSLDGGRSYDSVPLTATGNPDEYRGEIPAQPCGSIVRYFLAAETTAEIAGTDPAQDPQATAHTFRVGRSVPVLVDDAESDRGWQLGVDGDDAIDGIWERGIPIEKRNGRTGGLTQPGTDRTPAPGVTCFATRGSGGYFANGDVDGGRTTLLSPRFDWSGSPGAARIGFHAFFANEPPVDDTLRCSVSNDDGATWIDLVEIHGEHANEWRAYGAFVSSAQIAFSDRMRVRFLVEDRNSSLCEAAIDDISIDRTGCDGPRDEAADPDSGRLPGFSVRPNPSAGSSEIRFALAVPGEVRLEVYDASGRAVRRLAERVFASGEQVVSWDGRDDHGRPVGSGVYWVRSSASGRPFARKLLIVR